MQQTSRLPAFQHQRYMWHYSMQSLPISQVTKQDCELLPHIFTLTALHAKRRLFSVALFLVLLLKQPAVNRCIALRCPDFPLRINTERQPADRIAKISLFSLLYQNALGLLPSNLCSAFVAAVRSTPHFASLCCGVLLPIRQPFCCKIFFRQLLTTPNFPILAA